MVSIIRNENQIKAVLQLMGLEQKLTEPDWRSRYAITTKLKGCLARAVSKSDSAQGLFLVKLDSHGTIRWVTDISHLEDHLPKDEPLMVGEESNGGI